MGLTFLLRHWLSDKPGGAEHEVTQKGRDKDRRSIWFGRKSKAGPCQPKPVPSTFVSPPPLSWAGICSHKFFKVGSKLELTKQKGKAEWESSHVCYVKTCLVTSRNSFG